MPEVSVIIPIYNTAAYLRKALDSICGQTLKELEIILIDDGEIKESGTHDRLYRRKPRHHRRIRETRRKNPVVRAAQPGIIRCTQPRIAACYRQVHIFYGQ